MGPAPKPEPTVEAPAFVPVPPRIASSAWLRAFAQQLGVLMPGLSEGNAMRCAVVAHERTWLLEPHEAASLWLSAPTVAVRKVRRLPRNLLG